MTFTQAERSRLPAPMRRASGTTLALMMVLATKAVGAPPQPPTITVEAQRDRAVLERRVKRFVSGIAKVPVQDSLARWERTAICFAIAGLAQDPGEFVLDRLSTIAGAAGAPLAPTGCKPNFYVVATAVPDELVQGWSKQDPAIFGDASPKKIHDFAAASTPIRVLYNVALYNSDGTPCRTVFAGGDPLVFCGGGDLKRGAVRDLSSVIVLIDTRRTTAINFAQVAAYVAMVGLAEIREHTRVADVPTILSLFSDSANAPAEGLSVWDSAYLKALYHTDHSDRTQVLKIGHSMIKEIVP